MDESLLQQVLAVFIDVFLVVGDQGLISMISSSSQITQIISISGRRGRVGRICIYLADGLSDGVDLAGLTTSGHTHADVDIGELIEANDEKGLVDLEAQDGGFDETEGLSCNRKALEL